MLPGTPALRRTIAVIVSIMIVAWACTTGDDAADTDTASTEQATSDEGTSGEISADPAGQADDGSAPTAVDGSTAPASLLAPTDVMCARINDDQIHVSFINRELELSTIFLTVEHRDATTAAVGTDFFALTAIRPGEVVGMTLDPTETGQASCAVIGVDAFPEDPAATTISPAGCQLTSPEGAVRPSGSMSIATADPNLGYVTTHVAFIDAAGRRVATGTGFINGPLSIDQVHTLPVDAVNDANAVRCELVLALNQ